MWVPSAWPQHSTDDRHHNTGYSCEMQSRSRVSSVHQRVAVCALGILLFSVSTIPAGSEQRPAPSPVVVEKPGPPLWRVSRNNHVVWLLGVPEYVPEGARWRLREVEAVLANSREVVMRPSAALGAGPITSFRALRLWTRKSNGLQNDFDAETYARFIELKSRYAPNDRRMEKLQPILAVSRLRDAAIAQSGLRSQHLIDDTVAKVAKERRVPVRRPKWSTRDSRTALGFLQNLTGEQGTACSAATIDALDSEMVNLVARANAWADGDLDSLRRLAGSRDIGDCMALQSQSILGYIEDATNAAWLAAVQTALENNVTSLALTTIDDLLDPDGNLKKLRERGYIVEAPVVAGTYTIVH
jgi:hypothetical protein